MCDVVPLKYCVVYFIKKGESGVGKIQLLVIKIYATHFSKLQQFRMDCIKTCEGRLDGDGEYFSKC